MLFLASDESSFVTGATLTVNLLSAPGSTTTMYMGVALVE